MSERSGGRERSEQSGASERVSGASERANGRASGPVLQSVFLAVIDHSGLPFLRKRENMSDAEREMLRRKQALQARERRRNMSQVRTMRMTVVVNEP